MKNKSLSHKTTVVIMVIAIAALPIGCLTTSGKNTSPLITSSPQFSVSTTSILENIATDTALPTRKPTATFPPTRTPLPPQTDLPTIEPSDINTMIDSLYSRCKLPCWGSIIPGKTSQYAAKRFLSPLGEWYEGSESLGGVTIEYNNLRASISLLLEHGLVDSIHLGPALTWPYRINRLFTEYGVPEDVRIEVLPLTAELTTWWWLVLLYPHQGFFAVLSAEGTVINSIINICPRDVSPNLYLFASNTYSLNEMSEIVSIIEPHSAYQPLNAVTDIDITQYYEIFSNQSVNCIATNVKFQLP